jgi:hypothetical protein
MDEKQNCSLFKDAYPTSMTAIEKMFNRGRPQTKRDRQKREDKGDIFFGQVGRKKGLSCLRLSA